jgi:hypothetical protein
MVAVLGVVIGVVAVALAAWGLKVAIWSSKSADESATAAKSSAETAKQILDMARADQERRELVRVRDQVFAMLTLFRHQNMSGPLAIWAGAPEMVERSEAAARLAALLSAVESLTEHIPRTCELSTCSAVNWSSTVLDQALDEINARIAELPAPPDALARLG